MGAKPPEDRLIGKTLEKCRILAKLGTGGMGSVWLAEHFGLNRKVAVKILPSDMGRDPEYVARFMREATTAGRMEHPNIVQIHDVGYAEGRHFIVMQYVDGESLSTVVDHLGAMEPRDAARVAVGIFRGLQHAHEQGIVHRDVKPDNVLIAKGDRPMILDFGLAIETEASLHITKDGMVVGTPYYLAPEQARGQKATPACDLYSAGVTLYYLLTGKRPFVGATALAVLNKHIHEAPVPPMKVKADIPRPLNDIVLRLMAKKPEDRYRTAADAAQDLENFLKGREVRVRTPSRLAALSRKQMIALGAGAGAAVLLIVVLAAALSGKKPPPPPSAPQSVPLPQPAALAPGENVDLLACRVYEKDHREDVSAFNSILDKYDSFIETHPDPRQIESARNFRKQFMDHVEKKAQEEFDRLMREEDPFFQLQALRDFPRPLKELTLVDARLREERPRILERVEKRFLDDWEKLIAARREYRYPEAREILERMLRVADGVRHQELEKIRGDLPRLEREFEDKALHQLVLKYAAVREEFERCLRARDNARGYTTVAAFLRDLKDEGDRSRARVPSGVNYDSLLAVVPDAVLSDFNLGGVRTSLASTMGRAQETFPWRILADLQDALDLEYLIRATGQGLSALTKLKPAREIRMETFRSNGTVTLGPQGYRFNPRASGIKPIVIRELHPKDLVLLAAAAEGATLESVYESNELLCRAAGVAYLYSSAPERWAESARWFRRALDLGLASVSHRLESVRESGYREIRERIARSKADASKGQSEVAKQLLTDVAGAWVHDVALKEETGRALADILTREILQLDKARDYNRVRQTAKVMRTTLDGLYDEPTVHPVYAHALRTTGTWRTVAASLKPDTWSWTDPVPAVDEASLGLKLSPGAVLALKPDLVRGASGFSIQLRFRETARPFAAGIRFDFSDKDARYRKLVIQAPGDVALYEGDGPEERRVRSQPLETRLGPGQWVDIAFISEGEDLVCYVDQRVAFIVRTPLVPDRQIGLWAATETNVRMIQLRK